MIIIRRAEKTVGVVGRIVMKAAATSMMAAVMLMTTVDTAMMAEMMANASPAKAIGSKSITRALTKMARNLNQRMTAGLLRPFDSVVAMS